MPPRGPQYNNLMMERPAEERTPLEVLPVLDLLGGLVVRGVGGRREEYRPIESILCADARPATVARAFASLGFRTVYVADLDAIQGDPPAWPIYRELLDCGLGLWIDAGLSDPGRAAELAAFSAGIVGIVAGLESLAGPESLGELVAAIGPERLVFSLDLKAGRPLAAAGWGGRSPQEIARLAISLGVRRVLVLDLARVGEGEGVGTESLCRWLRGYAPDLELTAGGGVRSADDLALLAEWGCDGALVASALHDGRLTADDCRRPERER